MVEGLAVLLDLVLGESLRVSDEDLVFGLVLGSLHGQQEPRPVGTETLHPATHNIVTHSHTHTDTHLHADGGMLVIEDEGCLGLPVDLLHTVHIRLLSESLRFKRNQSLQLVLRGRERVSVLV